jgi:hypothetical protein
MVKKAQDLINRRLKILVAIPSGGDWTPEFGMSMCKLLAGYTGTKIQLVVQNTRGSMLGNNREKLLVSALKRDCTHIFFLDDDMSFPPEILRWLLLAKKKFVAAAGVTKSDESHCVAVDLDNDFVDLKTCRAVVEVRSVGLACALIELEPLKKSRPPHFMMEWVPDEKKQCGEDVYFCARWLELGESIWIHRDASRALGHVGSYVYTYEDVKDGTNFT